MILFGLSEQGLCPQRSFPHGLPVRFGFVIRPIAIELLLEERPENVAPALAVGALSPYRTRITHGGLGRVHEDLLAAATGVQAQRLALGTGVLIVLGVVAK